ncbi:MAG: hypothetical protein LBS84_08805 [Clostridiales bacterium]|jgi:predicted HTH transcriptional regulator|nr:hypothetical protein [Clostridiales bacterium]
MFSYVFHNGKFKTPLSPDNDEEFLLKLKLLTDDESGICPTVSGVLMGSSRPNEYIWNAFIQAVAYSGVQRNAIYQLDAKDIEGPLDVQIKEACDFVRKNTRINEPETLDGDKTP